MIVDAENMGFGQLLQTRYPMIIPKYQRAYAWDEEEIDDFIKDINDLYTNRISNKCSESKSMSHFFGGIVSVKRTVAGSDSGNDYDIVDGQQRLTTMTLALIALLQGFEDLALESISNNDSSNHEASNAHQDVINKKYVTYFEVVKNKIDHKMRLTLSKADNDFFVNLVKNQNNARKENSFVRDSHRRLHQAWNKIFEKLIKPLIGDNSKSISEKIEDLLVIKDCLTVDCNVIHIISDNHQEAYRLFSILNDRGKTLNDGDLLRSHTLEILENFSIYQDQVERAWNNMLSYRDEQIDHFLKSYYPSVTGKRAPQREVASAYREMFFNKTLLTENDAKEILAHIQEMNKESIAFNEIIEGRWPYQDTIAKAVAWDKDRLARLIKVLKHTLCFPLLLSAYAKLTEKDFAKIINIIERFSFRYITIVRAHAGRLGEIYNKHAREIRLNSNSYNIGSFIGDLKKLQDKYAYDSLFRTNLLEKVRYDESSNRANIKYFLSTLEDYYKWYQYGHSGFPNPNTMTVFDLNTITIEHIYPQNPTIPDLSLSDKVHNIGNLSFWAGDENQKAGNKDFINKKPLYEKSNVQLNRELFSLSVWDIDEFTKRQNRIIDMALKIFTA